jgi:hypothetical protein
VWDEVKADGQGGLAERAGRKLVQSGGLYTSYPPVLLRLHLDGPLAPLWEAGSVAVNEVWAAYARYLYLHRLKDLHVLLACVAAAPGSTVWATEGMAVAEAIDPRQPGRFVGLAAGEMAPNTRGTTLIVQPALAEAQLAENQVGVADTADWSLEAQNGTAVVGRRPEATRQAPRRFYGVVTADPDRLGRDAGRIAQEIVAHLHGLVGTETEVTIEIRATNAGGFPDTVVKIVSENASALRFTDQGFEQS